MALVHVGLEVTLCLRFSPGKAKSWVSDLASLTAAAEVPAFAVVSPLALASRLSVSKAAKIQVSAC